MKRYETTWSCPKCGGYSYTIAWLEPTPEETLHIIHVPPTPDLVYVLTPAKPEHLRLVCSCGYVEEVLPLDADEPAEGRD